MGILPVKFYAQSSFQSPLNLTITFDSWPEESSWDIVYQDSILVYSADYSTLGDDSDGATIHIANLVVPPGTDYSFSFYDAFIDGICCLQGEGSFVLKDANDDVIMMGGDFETVISSEFEIEGDLCTNGYQDDGEDDIDCGGQCAPCVYGCMNEDSHNYNPIATTEDNSCETCNDGILNGDEENIDCGGTLCTPCTPICQDTFNTIQPFVGDTTIAVNELITTCHEIDSGLNIEFRAGQEIIFHAGFEIEGGASFEAKIEGCEE